jgi:glycerol-3-phosphate acyltransferase PlsX
MPKTDADPLIALDVMGGDNAPGAIVEGAVMAARQLGVRVALVGQTDAIERELTRLAPRPETIMVVDAPEVIEMDESPAQAARQKKQSSIVVGLRMLKQGEADAFVSAGNTGAVMAGAIMYVGRVRGIERPSLVGLLPLTGKLTVFLDVGANADARPEYLLQWAEMASAYMEHVWKVKRPSVGLLNIGEEESKGSAVVQEAFELLEASGLNFIGHGRSDARAVFSALRMAREAAQSGVLEAIRTA